MKIIECPRDAMQGLTGFVPTELKIRYLNALLKVGFDTLDFGSFVSPKAIPQMADTEEVVNHLQIGSSKTKLLAIVANVRGASDALDHDIIDYVGYPLSISETFQQRNTNRSIKEAIYDVTEIQELCDEADRTLVVYLSMGFGNPYGDLYTEEFVEKFVEQLDRMEVSIISLSDTVGVATPDSISYLFEKLVPKFPHIEFGAHLHSTPTTAQAKVKAAYEAGVRRIDGTLRGFGGCPMAEDKLVGNLDTEQILVYLASIGQLPDFNVDAWKQSKQLSVEIFG